jgi:hypothetical protein
MFNRRGADRLVTPPCPECKATASVVVATRTDYVVYFRCTTCATVWSAQKPGRSLAS